MNAEIIPFPGRKIDEQAQLLFSYAYEGADYFGTITGILQREIFYRPEPCLVVLVETLPDLTRSIEFHEYDALKIELIFLSHHAERDTLVDDIIFTPAGLKEVLGPNAKLFVPPQQLKP